MSRPLALLAALLALLLGTASGARAEEVFVLDNGMILRGSEVRRDADEVVIRLKDVGGDARVTVAAARIVRRYDVSVGPAGGRATLPALSFATDLLPPPTPPTPAPGTPPAAERVAALPAAPLEEPGPRQETYFARLTRLARMAAPADPTTCATLAGLGLLVLFVLVLIGAQLLEIRGVRLWKAAALALAFGGLLLALAVGGEALMRADRALWTLPLLCGAYLGVTWGLLRCAPRRAVLLLAYLGFSTSVVVFAAGAVLMLC